MHNAFTSWRSTLCGVIFGLAMAVVTTANMYPGDFPKWVIIAAHLTIGASVTFGFVKTRDTEDKHIETPSEP